MLRIVTESTAMLNIASGKELGVTVIPLCVTLNGEPYREYEEISTADFIKEVRSGGTCTSASPVAGDVIAAYDQLLDNPDDEILQLSIADGLSGTYEQAVGLAASHPCKDRITVVNTKTLCVPQNIIVKAALRIAREGATAAEATKRLQPLLESHKSFLIPEDFDYLMRGGRLTPLAAKTCSVLKAVPVMTQTEDGKRLERFSLSRKLSKALAAIIEEMRSHGVTEGWAIGITHSDNMKRAEECLKTLKEAFPKVEFILQELGPVFSTQGGPGCVAIQTINTRM